MEKTTTGMEWNGIQETKKRAEEDEQEKFYSLVEASFNLEAGTLKNASEKNRTNLIQIYEDQKKTRELRENGLLKEQNFTKPKLDLKENSAKTPPSPEEKYDSLLVKEGYIGVGEDIRDELIERKKEEARLKIAKAEEEDSLLLKEGYIGIGEDVRDELVKRLAKKEPEQKQGFLKKSWGYLKKLFD
jgi:hypothetical protein